MFYIDSVLNSGAVPLLSETETSYSVFIDIKKFFHWLSLINMFVREPPAAHYHLKWIKPVKHLE